MKRFLTAIRERLPGGILFFYVVQSLADRRYGFRVTAARVLYHLRIYCFGCARSPARRSVAPLRPPYPALYHFSSPHNRESILEKGLTPNDGCVWLTDWTNPRWAARLEHQASAIFQIDTELLISGGHSVFIMNRCHEFTTDFVPPDCLNIVS